MKKIIVLCVFLSGCASGPVVWIQTHAAEITAFSMVAGATSAGISAINAGIDLKQNLEEEIKK